MDILPARKRVMIILKADLAYTRLATKGIFAYAHASNCWDVRSCADLNDTVISFLTTSHVDGVITMVGDEKNRQELSVVCPHLVNISGRVADIGVPSVLPDNIAIGRMAGQYFLDRGYRHFAYFGLDTLHFSQQREHGFCEVVVPLCHSYTKLNKSTLTHGVDANLWEGRERLAREWFATLPRPIAIFAVNDECGKLLLDMGCSSKIAIPDEVAILGVDDDEALCLTTTPQLSSVIVPSVQLGMEAARMLDSLMSGAIPPASPLLLSPVGIETRGSTDATAHIDPLVAQALQYIKQHAHEPISVQRLLEEIPLSRRALELHFREALGKSPLEVISHVRVQRAQRLLADTDLAIGDVAKASGLVCANSLYRIFKREVGMTPQVYREQFRVR